MMQYPKYITDTYPASLSKFKLTVSLDLFAVFLTLGLTF